jgi:drug/metabolite transporter (DMT)-like permease
MRRHAGSGCALPLEGNVMTRIKSAWLAHGATSSFVVLWSSGAVFARLGLDHASPLAFLALRFALALAVLQFIALTRRPRVPPAPGSRSRIAGTGLLLLGTYSICYFLALDHGVTPGVLATVLGAQPVLTLVVTERRLSPARVIGLGLALGGLILVVLESVVRAEFSAIGMACAFGALAGMTAGAILQKGIAQPPLAVLPLQYGVSLVLCLGCLGFEPLRIDPGVALVVPLLWLAIAISVIGQLLLYRLIQTGNLVNVTSLFYLVPIATAVMDHWILGNALSPLNLGGMAAIVAGLVLVFRGTTRPAGRPDRS